MLPFRFYAAKSVESLVVNPQPASARAIDVRSSKRHTEK